MTKFTWSKIFSEWDGCVREAGCSVSFFQVFHDQHWKSTPSLPGCRSGSDMCMVKTAGSCCAVVIGLLFAWFTHLFGICKMVASIVYTLFSNSTMLLPPFVIYIISHFLCCHLTYLIQFSIPISTQRLSFLYYFHSS